jgi:hypothetical protein
MAMNKELPLSVAGMYFLSSMWKLLADREVAGELGDEEEASRADELDSFWWQLSEEEQYLIEKTYLKGVGAFQLVIKEE